MNCCDYINCYQNTTDGCDWCFQGMAFIIVVLPPLLILIAFGIPCAVATFVVLIAPAYFIALVSFVYMIIYSV